MRWFVHVAAEYYAYSVIVEADTAEEAAELARGSESGNTYARYADEGDPPGSKNGYAVPACAVCPFDAVTFTGSENRVNYLVDPVGYEYAEWEKS